MTSDWIVPDWPVPPVVGALITTRKGGVSQGPYGGGDGGGMNLSLACGDDPVAVDANRRRVSGLIGARPVWLRQVHGSVVVAADEVPIDTIADASFTRKTGLACTVMVADCLPVLFSDEQGQVVAAAHAGWRGLAAGVLENVVARMEVAPSRVLAYLGPAIGASAFEVGDDVLRAFCERDGEARHAFREQPGGKYFADLFALARLRLARIGIERIFGGGDCTVSDAKRFYSYRRERTTGRMAALIWRADAALTNPDPACTIGDRDQ
jgi:YfiH family protein